MKTAVQIDATAGALKNVSDRLVTQEFLRAESIQKIKDDKRLSDSARQEELAKVSGMEVLKALHAQIAILKAELDAGKADWDNLAAVLRAAALPLGATPATAATMGLLRDEAKALESDPAALQAAMEDAAVTKDWPRLYSLCLGRCDENGMPLRDWKGVIAGIRLDCCDLPGQLAVMEALAKGEEAALKAEAAWSHAIGQSGMTTVALLANAPAKLVKAKFDREARMLLTPAEALQRAEDERTNQEDRYAMVESPNAGTFTIFDRANGTTRTVDAASGPAYLAKLNALTRIPTPAEGLLMVSPVTGEN